MSERHSATSAESGNAFNASAEGDASAEVAAVDSPPRPAPRCPFARMFGSATLGSLAARLKESTKELHHAAEHHPLQQAIVRGSISRDEYAAFASAMRQVHSAMESHLDALAERDERVSAVFLDRHRRLDAFDRDIELLGGSSDRAPVVQASDWLGRSFHSHPLSWLGVLYVVEGSSNGGQAIARVLRRTWILENDTLKSLDPHGSATREFWGEFRSALDAQQFSASEQDAIVAGAAATFVGITRLMDSLPCWEMSTD